MRASSVLQRKRVEFLPCTEMKIVSIFFQEQVVNPVKLQSQVHSLPQPCEKSPLRNITVELRSDLTMWTASDFLYVAHLGSPVTKKKNKNCQEGISPALGIFWVHHLSIASGGLSNVSACPHMCALTSSSSV